MMTRMVRFFYYSIYQMYIVILHMHIIFWLFVLVQRVIIFVDLDVCVKRPLEDGVRSNFISILITMSIWSVQF